MGCGSRIGEFSVYYCSLRVPSAFRSGTMIVQLRDPLLPPLAQATRTGDGASPDAGGGVSRAQRGMAKSDMRLPLRVECVPSLAPTPPVMH